MNNEIKKGTKVEYRDTSGCYVAIVTKVHTDGMLDIKNFYRDGKLLLRPTKSQLYPPAVKVVEPKVNMYIKITKDQELAKAERLEKANAVRAMIKALGFEADVNESEGGVIVYLTSRAITTLEVSVAIGDGYRVSKTYNFGTKLVVLVNVEDK